MITTRALPTVTVSFLWACGGSQTCQKLAGVDIGDFFWLKNEMHMPLGDYHVITGPSVLLWGLA